MLLILLLLGGLRLWLFGSLEDTRWLWELTWAGLAFLISSWGPLVRWLSLPLESARNPSLQAKRWIAAGLSIIAMAYLLLTAWHQGRHLIPQFHDEFAYLIQMQMLARGRLWMPALPLPEFFDNFYLLVDRHYAAIYFPGTALLYTPLVWAHLPVWLGPVLISGVSVWLLYRIVTELLDGQAGILAILLLLGISRFRMLSTMILSQLPVMCFGLLMVWGWLCWRTRHRRRWLLLIGVAAGWAAVTRPADALAFAIPVGAAILLDLYRRPWRSVLTSGMIIIGGAAPFLALLMGFNRGITGSFFHTPHEYYVARDYPGATFGFHGQSDVGVPISTLAQKREFYKRHVLPAIESHRISAIITQWREVRWPYFWNATLPTGLLLVLIPAGLLLLPVRRLWVMPAIAAGFIGIYVFYCFFESHYAVVAAPSVILLALMGKVAVDRHWPWGMQRGKLFSCLVIVGVAVLSLPELSRIHDEFFPAEQLAEINQQLKTIPTRAVVLFTFDPMIENTFVEPCYNVDVAWPDDARIIRAHDLEDHNPQLYRYYAQTQPDRMVYRYIRSTRTLTFLGNVAELASHSEKLSDVRLQP